MSAGLLVHLPTPEHLFCLSSSSLPALVVQTSALLMTIALTVRRPGAPGIRKQWSLSNTEHALTNSGFCFKTVQSIHYSAHDVHVCVHPCRGATAVHRASAEIA